MVCLCNCTVCACVECLLPRMSYLWLDFFRESFGFVLCFEFLAIYFVYGSGDPPFTYYMLILLLSMFVFPMLWFLFDCW